MRETACLMETMLWELKLIGILPLCLYRSYFQHAPLSSQNYKQECYLFCLGLIPIADIIPWSIATIHYSPLSVPGRILLVILTLSTSESSNCSSVLISSSSIVSGRSFSFKTRWLPERKLFVLRITIIYFFQDSNVFTCTSCTSPRDTPLVSLVESATLGKGEGNQVPGLMVK